MDEQSNGPIEVVEPSDKSDVRFMRMGELVEAMSMLKVLQFNVRREIEIAQAAASSDKNLGLDLNFRTELSAAKERYLAASRDVEIVKQDIDRRFADSDHAYHKKCLADDDAAKEKRNEKP